jgi:hypothetical protein
MMVQSISIEKETEDEGYRPTIEIVCSQSVITILRREVSENAPFYEARPRELLKTPLNVGDLWAPRSLQWDELPNVRTERKEVISEHSELYNKDISE